MYTHRKVQLSCAYATAELGTCRQASLRQGSNMASDSDKTIQIFHMYCIIRQKALKSKPVMGNEEITSCADIHICMNTWLIVKKSEIMDHACPVCF